MSNIRVDLDYPIYDGANAYERTKIQRSREWEKEGMKWKENLNTV